MAASAPIRIALIGAECTGKTELAQALQARLQPDYPGVQWVPEYLREWCAAQGRTPMAAEQAAIADEQMRRIQAQANAPLLLCDTTPLVTAVYSELLFGDTTLYKAALAAQAGFALTLLTGTDLPWVADGLQRDGAAMRTRFDQRLRALLQTHGIAYAAVYGQGEARTQNALQALQYALGLPRPTTPGKPWQWSCEKCSDPACEHRLFQDLLAKNPAAAP